MPYEEGIQPDVSSIGDISTPLCACQRLFLFTMVNYDLGNRCIK